MKTGTPVPKRENELKSTGSGPVVTYTLPPEEIEKVRPTREKFLQLRAAGMAHAKIERELGIPQGSLSYWLRKWNLKGVTVEKARELLEQDATGAAEPSRSAEDAAPADPYREVAERLFEAAPVAIDLEPDPAARVIAAEVELHRQKDETIERLTKELAEKAVRINELEQRIEELKANAVRLVGENAELRRTISEMEAERNALLQTVEKAVDAAGHDPVNHPAHYTAGKVECIDAIESATVGLTGGVAYCTGAAIKYLWRWSRKGGVEDLKKARWYIDRLIREMEENAS